jgi:hypothetical protein
VRALKVPATEKIQFRFTGDAPAGDLILNLPAFLKGNIQSATTGMINNAEGTVTVPGNTRNITVTLKSPQAGSVLSYVPKACIQNRYCERV